VKGKEKVQQIGRSRTQMLPVSFSLFRVVDIAYSTMLHALQPVKKYLGIHSLHVEISLLGTVNRLVQVGKCLSKTI
jgi:hypothetical protein